MCHINKILYPSGEEPLTAATETIWKVKSSGVWCVFFFRVRITQSRKMNVYTRSFEISGTTHCCLKLSFFWGGRLNVTFGLRAMDTKNVLMYGIYFAVELIHKCSQNPTWWMHVLHFLHVSVIFVH
jgi:hypothetical protein